MRRSLLLLFGIIAITCLEFFFFPGHTYLAGESQSLVAMMERLQSPGFLSRDLVATNPNLSYTLYDEITLFLCRFTRHDFQSVLGAQQLAFRFAGVLGLVLIGLSARLTPLLALVSATLVSAGASLPGLHLALTDPEPTPFAFSLALTLLALGLLTRAKPLLAGLFGGIALVYQPSIGSVFWLLVIACFIRQRSLRPVLRPTFPALLVFSLLLANASQLQPGSGEAHPFFEKVSDSWMRLQIHRTPELWVSTWSIWSLVFYTGIVAAGFLALSRLWPELTALARWVLVGPILFGAVTIPLAAIGLQVFRWAFVGEVEIERSLTMAFALSILASAAASSHAWHQNRRRVACIWCLPLLSTTALLGPPGPITLRPSESRSVQTIAQWAERNTWGGSMFLFPDAGQSPVPGEFRARSIRAVYVDWVGGALTKTFPIFGAEWDRRWREAGGEKYSVSHLQQLLQLPVEYIVLQRRNALEGILPEISTPDYVVYDAHALQTAERPLRTLHKS